MERFPTKCWQHRFLFKYNWIQTSCLSSIPRRKLGINQDWFGAWYPGLKTFNSTYCFNFHTTADLACQEFEYPSVAIDLLHRFNYSVQLRLSNWYVISCYVNPMVLFTWLLHHGSHLCVIQEHPWCKEWNLCITEKSFIFTFTMWKVISPMGQYFSLLNWNLTAFPDGTMLWK